MYLQKEIGGDNLNSSCHIELRSVYHSVKLRAFEKPFLISQSNSKYHRLSRARPSRSDICQLLIL